MTRTSIAVLFSAAVMIGSLDTAWSAPNANLTASNSVQKNESPLPPGGAAGIRQAQGTDWSGPLIGAAVTGGIFLAILLLVEGDDSGVDTVPVTTH